MKKFLLWLTMFSMVSVISYASIVPVKLANNTEFNDDEIYVAIIGRFYFPEGEFGCYYDLRNNTQSNTHDKAR